MTDDSAAVLDAVAESLGRTIESAHLIQVEPSGSGTVSGHAVRWRDDDGVTSSVSLYVETAPPREGGPGESRPGVLVLSDDEGGTATVWLYPGDPALPTLPAAVYPDAAALLLERLGVDATDLTLSVVAYRPGKRAVIRMTTAERVLFLKVVRPGVVDALVDRHRAWIAAGLPAPEIIAWAPDGLVAIEALRGVELSTVLDEISEHDLLDTIDGLTRRIAEVSSPTPARPSLLSRLDWYEDRVSRAVVEPGTPSTPAAVSAVCARIRAIASDAGPPEALVTIHGDLHVGQIFVDPHRPTTVTGVLDIDTAGLGDPADDAAALWAHLEATACHRRARGDAAFADRVHALATTVREGWTTRGPRFARRVAAIAAVHLLGHALSTTIPLETALDLVDQILADEILADG
ncbi:phosphotransferase family protein [Marisediminicola sp. LYQ85]|uniref:phosphotransferase family protein n=1 Tax=Marisediminicola sp. LYQ85 TaxID=3391062 RepID=UPI003983447A